MSFEHTPAIQLQQMQLHDLSANASAGLDKVTAEMGRSIDDFINNQIIGRLGKALDFCTAKITEGLSKGVEGTLAKVGEVGENLKTGMAMKQNGPSPTLACELSKTPSIEMSAPSQGVEALPASSRQELQTICANWDKGTVNVGMNNASQSLLQDHGQYPSPSTNIGNMRVADGMGMSVYG